MTHTTQALKRFRQFRQVLPIYNSIYSLCLSGMLMRCGDATLHRGSVPLCT